MIWKRLKVGLKVNRWNYMSGKRKILFSTFQKTDVKIGNESIETVSETKLLETITYIWWLEMEQEHKL